MAQSKVKPKPTAAAKKAQPAPKVNPHAGKVDFGTYEGPSKGNNGNRAVKIMVRDAPTDLSDRCQKNLYALRKAYGNSAFPAKGIDNGILRDLRAAGLVATNGGKTETRDGHTYILDGAQPVMVKITAAGAKYGIA